MLEAREFAAEFLEGVAVVDESQGGGVSFCGEEVHEGVLERVGWEGSGILRFGAAGTLGFGFHWALNLWKIGRDGVIQHIGRAIRLNLRCFYGK